MAVSFGNDPEFDVPIQKPGSGGRFSLVRVFMILCILAILVALIIRAPRTARHAARRSQCVNNLKQIALAIQNYEQKYHSLPPAYTVDDKGRPLHSWRTLILPYMEQGSLYETIDLAKPWNDPANAQAMVTVVPVYQCPEAISPRNTTTYLAIATPDGCFNSKGSRRLDEITDAHESTVMLIEAGDENAVPWMAPTDANESLVMNLGPKARLHHPGGVNAGLIDGHVIFLKAITPAVVRQAMMSIAGNDDVIANEGK